MLKRVGTRLGLILLVADLGLTALALYLARMLRLTLPFGVYLGRPLAFGPWFYLLVPAIWALAFLALRIYDPARALHYLGDVRAVWSAVTWATLVFAGVAYLFFREFSRLLFVYFYLLDLAFLLGWRAILHWLLRLGLDRSLGEPRRVLVAGAGTGDLTPQIPAHLGQVRARGPQHEEQQPHIRTGLMVLLAAPAIEVERPERRVPEKARGDHHRQ